MTESHDAFGTVEDLLVALETAGAADFVGGRLMRASLARHKQQLLTEHVLSASYATTESLDVGLAPADGSAGAEVTFVSSLLSSLQETVTAVAQSLRDRPTARGVVPVDIQDQVRLRVAFALPGSLTLRLAPVPHEHQTTLEAGAAPLLDRSLDTLFDLFDQVANGEELLDDVAALGPRASLHLNNLASALARSDAGLTLRWRTPRSRRRVTLDIDAATRLAGFLRDVQESERERVYRGRLVGGSLVRATFELELDDGSLISGKVLEDEIERMAAFFGRPCTATVRIRETRSPSGETRESVHLLRLQD